MGIETLGVLIDTGIATINLDAGNHEIITQHLDVLDALGLLDPLAPVDELLEPLTLLDGDTSGDGIDLGDVLDPVTAPLGLSGLGLLGI